MDHTPKPDIVQNLEINNKGINQGGKPIYPGLEDGYPDGFDGSIVREQLETGMRVDRYGNLSGRYAAPEGPPHKNRALPPSSKKEPYTVFEVVAPIEVWGGRTASWFNVPGGESRN